MKRILFSILILLDFSLAGFAQTAGIYTLGGLNGGTNVVAAATTNSPAITFAVSEYDTVGIQVTLAASTTNTTAVVFKFAKTLDSTNYETTPSLSVSVTPNGVTSVTKVDSLSVANVAGLKLVSIENENANGYVTNVSVKYRVKAAKVLTR